MTPVFFFEGYNKTGEGVVQLPANYYCNGVVGAYNRTEYQQT